MFTKEAVPPRKENAMLKENPNPRARISVGKLSATKTYMTDPIKPSMLPYQIPNASTDTKNMWLQEPLRHMNTDIPATAKPALAMSMKSSGSALKRTSFRIDQTGHDRQITALKTQPTKRDVP